MADRTIHFAFGMIVGTSLFLPFVLKDWRAGKPLSRPLGRALLAPYVLGVLGLVPNMLRHAGLPESVCSGWWMNLFMLNPVVSRSRDGGMLIGSVLVVSIFAFQYLLAITALLTRKRLTGT